MLVLHCGRGDSDLRILPATADMYPRQPGIKILKYSFDVTLGDASDELVVNETV